MARQRLQEIRVQRNGTRYRNCSGGTVIGDYVDPTNGERVLTVKTVSIPRIKKAKKSQDQPEFPSIGQPA